MEGVFQLFGIRQLAALAVIFCINIALVLLRLKRYKNLRLYFRYGLVILLLISEAVWHIWNLWTGRWSLETMLPLELCSVMTYVNCLALITQNPQLYPFCYFLGVGGAMSVLLTPLDNSELPDFIFFQTLISHGTLLTTGLYVITVEKYHPYFKTVPRVFIMFNIYGAFVGIVNVILGSNYLFLAERPQIPSLLDLLPDWPWYLVYGEVLVLLIFLVLYLPFAFQGNSLRQLRKMALISPFTGKK